MNRYDDIIDLPHHVSHTHIPMDMESRAAQFAPFAALTGHGAAIAETARLTAAKPELSQDELDTLSRRLAYAIARNITIKITYFEPDRLKQGGSYRHANGRVKKVDEAAGLIVMTDGKSIPLDNVLEIASTF